jgi:uncharacterized protein (TIGR03086 family)
VADVIGRVRTAADGLTRSVAAGAAEDAWGAASPCEGWTAGDVIDHVTANYTRLAGALGVTVERTGDRAADWSSARDALLGSLERDGALDTVVDTPAGEMPLGKFLAAFLTTDTLVHSWDIARAVHADESLAAELCLRSFERALPADEMLRVPGMFGPKLDYADDDAVQVKMLRFYGRPA